MSKTTFKIGIDARLWNETGVGRYIRNLVWELVKIDTNNEYVLFFKKNEYDNVELPGKNFRKVLADIHWHSFKEQKELPKILERENLDLMHFPYFSVPIMYKKPFAVTIHDLIINHYPTGKASTRTPLFYWIKFFAYKFIVKQAVLHAKKIIAVSFATKKEIVDHYKISDEKIVVTYEGIDEKMKKGLSDKPSMQEKYFLYVGNAYPHKNLERLLSAFQLFKQEFHDSTKLILVGKEDFFYKRLKCFVKENHLEEDVLFYEKVSDLGLASLYQHALALVAPSLMEGFGLPLLEAMSFKTLILASSIDAFKEICQDSAFYFDPASVKDIAEKLGFIAKEKLPDASEKKQKGKQLAKQFSWERMAKETVKVYESCLSI